MYMKQNINAPSLIIKFGITKSVAALKTTYKLDFLYLETLLSVHVAD